MMKLNNGIWTCLQSKKIVGSSIWVFNRPYKISDSVYDRSDCPYAVSNIPMNTH